MFKHSVLATVVFSTLACGPTPMAHTNDDSGPSTSRDVITDVVATDTPSPTTDTPTPTQRWSPSDPANYYAVCTLAPTYDRSRTIRFAVLMSAGPVLNDEPTTSVWWAPLALDAPRLETTALVSGTYGYSQERLNGSGNSVDRWLLNLELPASAHPAGTSFVDQLSAANHPTVYIFKSGSHWRCGVLDYLGNDRLRCQLTPASWGDAIVVPAQDAFATDGCPGAY